MATPFSYTVPNWREGQPSAAEGALLQQAGANSGADGSAFVLAQGLAAQRQSNQDAYLRELMQQHQFAQQALAQHGDAEQRGDLIKYMSEIGNKNPGALAFAAGSPILNPLVAGTNTDAANRFAMLTKQQTDAEALKNVGEAANQFAQGGKYMLPGDIASVLAPTGVKFGDITRTATEAAAARGQPITMTLTGPVNPGSGAPPGLRIPVTPGTPLGPVIDWGNRQLGVPGGSGGAYVPTQGAPQPQGGFAPTPGGPMQMPLPVAPPNVVGPGGRSEARPSVLDGPADPLGDAQAAPVTPTMPTRETRATQQLVPPQNRPGVPPELVAAPTVQDSRRPDGSGYDIPRAGTPGIEQARALGTMMLARVMAVNREAYEQIQALNKRINGGAAPVMVVENGVWKYLGADGRTVDVPTNQ